MIRAGVFIGVDKTGALQKLNDAAKGAERMYEWALCQGMDKSNAKLITDAEGKVDPDCICEAIEEIIRGAGVDQLLVYFAGHGVNINRNEHWLLTDAPGRPNAAVNVTGSVELARYCGIQHVVFISDACRVAPEGIQAQWVRGTDVFPNEGGSEKAKPVDQFFACLLGRTAAELKDPSVAAGNYTTALYTNVLLEALKGERPEVLESGGTAGDQAQYVKPRMLEKYLESEVPARIRKKKLEQKVNQNPDAIITSDGCWMARIDSPALLLRAKQRGGADTIATPKNLRSITERLVRSAATGDQIALGTELYQAKAVDVPNAEDLADAVQRIATPFGPDHFESQCGIKIRGARVVNFFATRASVQLLGTNGDMLRVDNVERPAASVLLEFEGRFGTVVPAIPDFLATLTFDQGELVDVAYEPSANTWRWDLYTNRASEVRSLRAVAASSSAHGRFRLDQEDAIKVVQKMQYAKGIDPTLAIYAAYAYHDLQKVERIREMSGFLRDDLRVTFFDLELLRRELVDKSVASTTDIIPFFPLLSQGWALLGAHRVKLHPALNGIESTIQESLWSLFNHDGLNKLKQAIQTMEVR